MTIRHLRIFISVCRNESITRAAEDLNMTQPTVTRAVQELEDHYGRQLFERIHRRIYVTEAGKQLYKQALHVVSSMELMEKAMSDWDETGSLRVGAGITLGCILLPLVLSEFRKTHPLLKVHSVVTDRAKLQEMLNDNEIDFALIEGPPDDVSLARVPIGMDRMVLILPSGDPLCARQKITIPDLADRPIVISERGSASRNFLEHLFSIHGMKLKPVMESSSIPAIIEAVQAGAGISLIPQKLASLYGRRDAITERKLSYEVLTRVDHLVWHESKYLGRSSREFIELVRDCGAKVLE